LGIIVTVASLVVALWGIDLDEIRASFQRANYVSLPVFLAFLFLFYWLKAVRWKLLLCPLRQFQIREVAGPMMIGFMGNNVLPLRLGELARVLVFGREFNISKTAVLSSVVLERVFDTATILVFFGGSLLLVELPASYAVASLYLGGGDCNRLPVICDLRLLDEAVRGCGGVGIGSVTNFTHNSSSLAYRNA